MKFSIFALPFVLSGCGNDVESTTRTVTDGVGNVVNKGVGVVSRVVGGSGNQPPIQRHNPSYNVPGLIGDRKPAESDRLHFAMDRTKIAQKQMVLLTGMSEKMYVAAPLYLLIQAGSFRDYLGQIAQQKSPQLTGFSAVLMDLVSLMNQVWGDATPQAQFDIKPNLLLSLIQDYSMGLKDGRPLTPGDFIHRLLTQLSIEFSIFEQNRKIPSNKFESLFRQISERKASHEGEYGGARSHDPYHTRVEWVMKFSTPETSSNPLANFTKGLRERVLGRDPEWDDFTECRTCHKRIDFDDISGKWTKLPNMMFFELLHPNRALYDLSNQFVIIDGQPYARRPPSPGSTIYELRGYVLQDEKASKMRTVVRHAEKDEWFIIDESHIIKAPNNSPKLADIVQPGEGVSLVMYVKKDATVA